MQSNQSLKGSVLCPTATDSTDTTMKGLCERGDSYILTVFISPSMGVLCCCHTSLTFTPLCGFRSKRKPQYAGCWKDRKGGSVVRGFGGGG